MVCLRLIEQTPPIIENQVIIFYNFPMAFTEVKIIGPEYDGATNELGTLAGKMVKIMNHVAQLESKKHGRAALLDPAVIEIAPAAIEDDQFFVVQALHGAAQYSSGFGGIVEEAVFDLAASDTDVYLHDRERGTNYELTTIETIFLHRLGGLATTYDRLGSPMQGEIS